MNASILNTPAVQRELRANGNGGRIRVDSAAQLSLQRFNGEVVEVNEELVPIPVAGILLANTTNTIDNAGADLLVAPSGSILYMVCLSNSADTGGLVRQLRLCAGAKTSSPTSGQFYLAASGNGANWRVVGQCYMTGVGPDFIDSVTQRFCLNWANQIPRSLFACPGYNNNNAETVIAKVNAAYAPINAGTGDKVEWLSDGFGPVHLSMNAIVTVPSAAISGWGIGVDSTTQPTVIGRLEAAAVGNVPSHYSYIPAVGYRFASMLAVTGAGATYACDLIRSGAAADPYGTHLTGWVWQ